LQKVSSGNNLNCESCLPALKGWD